MPPRLQSKPGVHNQSRNPERFQSVADSTARCNTLMRWLAKY
jgi:hypothetical protein